MNINRWNLLRDFNYYHIVKSPNTIYNHLKKCLALYNRYTFLEMGLNSRQIKAVFYTKEKEFITNSIYQRICETSERTASRDLENLTELNVFERHGERKGTRYKIKYGY